MGLAIRLIQPGQLPIAGRDPVAPVPLWDADVTPVILGECRDSQGFPLPVTAALSDERRCDLPAFSAR